MEVTLPDGVNITLDENQTNLMPLHSIGQTLLNSDEFIFLINTMRDIHASEQKDYVSTQDKQSIITTNLNSSFPQLSPQLLAQLIRGVDYHLQSDIVNALIGTAIKNNIPITSCEDLTPDITQCVEKHRRLHQANLTEITLFDVFKSRIRKLKGAHNCCNQGIKALVSI